MQVRPSSFGIASPSCTRTCHTAAASVEGVHGAVADACRTSRVANRPALEAASRMRIA
jgi:hypothetical protein